MPGHTSHSIDPFYYKIAQRVEMYLKATPPTQSANRTSLKKLIKHSDPSTINYDKYVLEYAQMYWLRNYWKAVYFLEYEYSAKEALSHKLYYDTDALKILTLGAGPAADVVAYLVWLCVHGQLSVKKVHVALLDKRALQLPLAQKILNLVSDILLDIEVTYTSIHKEVLEWKPSRNSFDVIIMGHFLTANNNNVIMATIIQKALYACVENGDILIIERERDPIWEKAREMTANMGFVTYSTPIVDYKFKSMINSLPDKAIDSKITPHYLKARVPNKLQIKFVSNYFKSWRFQTSDFLDSVFVKSARFCEKPGLEPAVIGIEGIKEYWGTNPVLQRNIKLWIRDVAHSDYNSICAFEGEFDTPRKHIVIRGALSFHIDSYYGKVSSLNAYFGTDKSPLKD